MAIESWMRVNVADVNQSYVSNFLRDHKSLNQAFDPSRATSKDHAAALEQLSSLYGTVMEDGGLSDADRSSLSKLMTGSNQAFVDAYHDHNLASRYGVGLDVGYYEASDAEAGAQILAEAKAANADASAADPKTTTADATTASEPRRAADGRIIYDAAPSFEQVRAGNGSIGLGQKSDEIRDAQRALFEGGFYEGVYEQGTTADDVSDHFFGPKTEQAVQAWQKANGMEATGRLDGAALDKLLGGETAQVTTGAGNPSAQVTTGAANPSAQTFSVPAELQAEYDGVKAQVDAGVSGHRGRNLRNRLKSLEGQISQDGLATQYNDLLAQREDVAGRLERNRSGHTGRNNRRRLANLDAQLAALNPAYKAPGAQVTTGAGNPSAQVTTGAGNPSAQVTTGAGNPSAQVTTGAGNPSAQVTTGAGNPSAQTFSVPAELQAEYDSVKAQVDAGVSGHRGRNLRNRLKSLEGQISQDGLATEYQRLSTERDEVAARLDRNGSGHTGRNLRNRLASLDAQLAELRGE